MIADVIVLTGPPGAGKTTTARSLATQYPKGVHLHTDDFWHFIVSGAIPPYLPASDGQNQTVMTAIQRVAWTYAGGGFTTVVDGIVGPWMLPHFCAAEAGDRTQAPRVHYVVLRPSRDEALRRAQGRTGADALVDQAPITDLWDQFSNLGTWESHVIDTTAHTPPQTVAAVRAAVASRDFLLP